MSNASAPIPIFREEIVVPPSAIDENGHVNNVVFVQWMQDVATHHFNAAGCDKPMRDAGATWVVRSHHIEYLAPAFSGDRLQISTWVVNFSRVRSLRRYSFTKADGTRVVRGETDWVLVNVATGRPCSIPGAIRHAFVLVSDE